MPFGADESSGTALQKSGNTQEPTTTTTTEVGNLSADTGRRQSRVLCLLPCLWRVSGEKRSGPGSKFKGCQLPIEAVKYAKQFAAWQGGEGGVEWWRVQVCAAIFVMFSSLRAARSAGIGST